MKIIKKIGQGISRIENNNQSIKKRIEVIRYGIESGLNFIDTAPSYGNGLSEKITGEAIRDIRKKCFIGTKFYPSEIYTKKKISESVYRSLDNLKTDYIDLLQIHWPNLLVENKEIAEQLDYLYQKKIIRNIGVSNYSKNQIININCNLKRKIFSNQQQYNLLFNDSYTRFNKKSKIFFIGYSPLNNGYIAATQKQYNFLKKLSKKYSVSVATIAFSYLLNKGKNIILVSKMSSLDHIDDAKIACEFKLKNSEINKIEELRTIKIRHIVSTKISLKSKVKNKVAYKNLLEAIKNKLGLFPSTNSMSIYFKQKNILPIRVIKIFSKKYNYILDDYDFFDQVKKFWGWKLAYPNKKIPVYVINKFNKY
jgi:diketogulonate reductase-like aldo/keto reductase